MTIEVLSDVMADKPAEVTQDTKPAPEVETKPTEQNQALDSETEASEETQTETESEENESEEETESTENAENVGKPKKKGGFQRRIDKLNGRIAAREAELEHWKSMALKGAGDKKPVEQVETKKPAVVDGEPNPDSFDTHAEYVKAVARWEAKQIREKERQESQKRTFETEQANALKAHSDRVKSFVEKTTDFNDVISEVDDVPLSPTIQQLLITSDNGPELMYELAKNRADYERINQLAPLAAARELGKIEAKIAARTSEAKKPEVKKTTKAPAPIDPVGKGSAPIEKSISDPTLTQAEYERLRRAQLKQRGE